MNPDVIPLEVNLNKTISEIDAMRALSLYREAVRSIDSIIAKLIKQEFEDFTNRAIANLPLSSNMIDGEYTPEERRAYEEARQMLMQSIEFNPYFPVSHFALANADAELIGNDRAALAGYTESLRLDPGDGDVLCVMIWHLIKIGKLADARKELSNLQRLDHRHFDILNDELSKLEDAG